MRSNNNSCYKHLLLLIFLFSEIGLVLNGVYDSTEEKEIELTETL